VASHTSHTRQARKRAATAQLRKINGSCRSVRDYGWPRVATVDHGSDWALTRGTCVAGCTCMCVLACEHARQSTLTRAQLQHSVVVCSTVMPCHDLHANASSFNAQGLHNAVKPARLRRHPLQHALRAHRQVGVRPDLTRTCNLPAKVHNFVDLQSAPGVCHRNSR